MKKNFILIAGVCLVLLMALSVVSAGWFSGNAIKTREIDSGQSLYLYEGNAYDVTIEIEDGNKIKKNMSLYFASDTKIKLNVGGELTPFLIKGETINIGGLNIEVIKFGNAFWYKGYYTQIKISVSEVEKGSNDCTREDSCTLYEDEEMTVIIDSLAYKVGVEYMDNDEVVLLINGETRVPSSGKLSVGMASIYKDEFVAFILGIGKINKLEISGKIGSVEFYIDSRDGFSDLEEGETITAVVGGLTYEVEIDYIDNDEVVLLVDGIRVPSSGKLSVGGSVKIDDGIYLKVNDITKLEVVGEVGSVRFTIFEKATPTPSSEVTYAGVLDMLEKAQVYVISNDFPEAGHLEDSSCKEYCRDNEEICLFGFEETYFGDRTRSQLVMCSYSWGDTSSIIRRDCVCAKL